MLTTTAKNQMLDGGLATRYLSAHTAYSTTGTNEMTGGSYARVLATDAAASSASKNLSASVVLNIPASQTASFVGMWSAVSGGNFLGMTAVGGDEKDFYVDTAGNKVLLGTHGYVVNNQVVFAGGAAPTGLTEGTLYYVVTVGTANDFQVGATQGGAVIPLTGQASQACKVSIISPQVFGGSGGTLTITSYPNRADG